jgi:5-formyltetrahydrofolate cyclo-ligase
MPTTASLQDQKRRLRTDMRAERSASLHNNPNAANKLARVLTAHTHLAPNSIIGAYLAFRDEMDPAPLIAMLRAQGHKIALPRIIGKRQPLEFHLYAEGDELKPHAMGLLEPHPSAPTVDPDILLVPLLAFDRERNRLGYGGGYYDRTIGALLARKPLVTIGIAYASQEVAKVPVGPHDICLDKVITEVNVF